MHWPGIEPGPPAWQARILPLNHQCLDEFSPLYLCSNNYLIPKFWGCTAVGRVWVFFISHTDPWVSILVLFPPLDVGHPLGFASEASLEDLGLPL